MISFACIAVTSRFYRKESEVRRKSVKLLSFESFPHECGRRMSIRLPGRATLAHSLTLEGRAWLNPILELAKRRLASPLQKWLEGI